MNSNPIRSIEYSLDRKSELYLDIYSNITKQHKFLFSNTQFKMKKNRFSIFTCAIFMLSIFLSGCTKEDENDILNEKPNGNGTETPSKPKYDVYITINMPGTLSNNIPNESFKTIKISGDLNGTDIKALRSIMPYLSIIDLSDANIVEGGESYFNITHKTTKDVIGTNMFAYLSGSFTLILPKTAKYIDNYAFKKSTGLKELQFSSNISSLGEEVFVECTKLTSITIPRGITSIGNSCFQDCSSLSTIDIPSNLKTLGTSAFMDCKSLRTIEIPGTCSSIPDFCFKGCTSLQTVTLNEGVSSLEQYSFSGCSQLSSVNLPSSLSSIHNASFYNCSNLKRIVIPEKVYTLGINAFHGAGLTEIELSESLYKIEDYALACKDLKKIRIKKNLNYLGFIPFAVQGGGAAEYEVSEENKTFSTVDGVLTSKDQKTIIYYPTGRTDKSYTIPECITKIGDAAFFYNTFIEEVFIPESVTTIEERAFSLTKNLKVVHCKAKTPPSLGTKYNYQAFPDKTEILYVPADAVQKYKSSLWSIYFLSIEAETE